MHKQQVIYQIYPRSFADANGDGIGDLPGIMGKLDYLADLGVDILWLSPIFQSPNADNGYDISDYEAIMPEFGLMADFDDLLKGVHERGMRLIVDLVVNHSSDEHRWFQESRKSKDNPYRDYYIWRGANGRKEPNNWQSFFSGPAWTFDELTGEYYLHLFAEKQPDLNWENPALRQEIYRMMRFWLDKGVDGFRMDVIPFLSKEHGNDGRTFPDYPDGRYGDLTIHANGPRIHEFLQEMNREVLAHYPNCITVGEGFGVSAEQANLYVGVNRHELQMIYHFDHAVPREEHRFLDPAPELTLPELKAIFAKWDRTLDEGPDAPGWQNIYFGNHDNPRVLSRFGDPERYHYESATLLATVLLCQRGTPSLYQGDEIGMTNCPFNSIHEFDDIQVKRAWNALIGPDADVEKQSQFLQTANRIARDHARTPMQWSHAPNAGFTNGPRTWLKVNPNYRDINVAKQKTDPRSVINYYRNLLQFRKHTPVLHEGTYRDLLPEHPTVWAFERRLGEKILLVVANVSGQETNGSTGMTGEVLLSNYADADNTLRPFEARILIIRE
ncbi:MAG: alpha amylase catalytic region [Spirosoma sp.]|nr:alpha amylase catalytic region [Spirosoma sp.]